MNSPLQYVELLQLLASERVFEQGRGDNTNGRERLGIAFGELEPPAVRVPLEGQDIRPR